MWNRLSSTVIRSEMRSRQTGSDAVADPVVASGDCREALVSAPSRRTASRPHVDIVQCVPGLPVRLDVVQKFDTPAGPRDQSSWRRCRRCGGEGRRRQVDQKQPVPEAVSGLLDQDQEHVPNPAASSCDQLGRCGAGVLRRGPTSTFGPHRLPPQTTSSSGTARCCGTPPGSPTGREHRSWGSTRPQHRRPPCRRAHRRSGSPAG